MSAGVAVGASKTSEIVSVKEFVQSVLWPYVGGVKLTGTVTTGSGPRGMHLRFVHPDCQFWYPNGALASSFFLSAGSHLSRDTQIVFTLEPAGPREREKQSNPDLLQAKLISASEDEYAKAKGHFESWFQEVSTQERLAHLESSAQHIDNLRSNLDRTVQQMVDAKSTELDQQRLELGGKIRSLDEAKKQVDQVVEDRVRADKNKWQQLHNSVNKQLADLSAQKSSLDLRQKELDKFSQEKADFEASGAAAVFRALQNARKRKSDAPAKEFAPLDPSFLKADIYKLFDGATPKDIVQRFVLSLAAAVEVGQFIVLCGRTGVGKTSLVTRTAQFLGAACDIIPVRPAWIDPTDVLGFIDPDKQRFVPTPSIDAILEAAENTNRFHFLGLDEMNLSRVENYAADILSTFEKSRDGEPKSQLQLYSQYYEDTFWAAIDDAQKSETSQSEVTLSNLHRYPARVSIPKNLVLFGTLNLDESANAPSPKFLDRSSVIQFESPEPITLVSASSKSHGRPVGRTLLVGDFSSTISASRCTQNELNDFLKPIRDLNSEWNELDVRLSFRFQSTARAFFKGSRAFDISIDEARDLLCLCKVLPRLYFHEDDYAVGRQRTKKSCLESLLTKMRDMPLSRAAISRMLSSGQSFVKYLE